MGEIASGRNRVTVTAISDGACMEGESKEVLQQFPDWRKPENGSLRFDHQ